MAEMSIIKKIVVFPCLQIFLAAALLRIILAPFFFHPDIKTIFYISQFFANGVVNIYEYLAQNPEKLILGPFVYPPLAYFFFGSIFPLIRALAGPAFGQWLAMGNEAVAVPHIFRYLFLIKLLPFAFEFLVGGLLVKILKNSRERQLALLFWFFNPVNIYAVILMGQFDVVPAFFTLLALYWAVGQKKPLWGAVALGIGGAMKSYPLLFLPFLAIVCGRDWRQQIKLFILGVAPYVIFTLPFVTSPSFRADTLISGLSQRMFLLGLDIGFGERILVVLLALVILFLLAAWRSGSKQDLAAYFLAVPLFLLAGSHFHPQWLIWAMPFLAIFIAKENKLFLPVVILLMGWLGTILLFDDKFLALGLLSPLDPGILFLPPLRELLSKIFQPSLLQSIFHTLFSASAIWIVCLVVAGKQHERI